MNSAVARKSVIHVHFDPAVPVSKIKRATYNPKSRTEEKRLSRLLNDIRDTGQIYIPLIMTKSYELIDGHRRLAVAEILEFKTVPAILREMTAEDRKRAYASINATGQPTRATESLEVWINEPRAVTPARQKQFENMQERLGKVIVSRMASNGYSPRLFATATRLANYCCIDSDAFLRKAICWLMEHSAARQVEQAMMLEQPAATLVKAINRSQSLKMKLVTE